VLGLEHPDTLSSMSKLAAALYCQGKYEAAEAMSRRVLELREKVLGLEHPDTLSSMSKLAAALHCQGKYEAAEAMSRQALELREKMLGPEHVYRRKEISQPPHPPP
jgi:tetratricopeptide (TPR) repeat protein